MSDDCDDSVNLIDDCVKLTQFCVSTVADSLSVRRLEEAHYEDEVYHTTLDKNAKSDGVQAIDCSKSVDHPKSKKTFSVALGELHSSFFPTQDSLLGDFTSQRNESSPSKQGACQGGNHNPVCETSCHSTKPLNNIQRTSALGICLKDSNASDLSAAKNLKHDTKEVKSTACSSRSEKFQGCLSKENDSCSPAMFSSPDCCSTSPSKENAKCSNNASRKKDYVQSTVNASQKFKDFHSLYKKKIEQFHSTFSSETEISSLNTKCPSLTQKPVRLIKENLNKSPSKDILDSLPSYRCKRSTVMKEDIGAGSLSHSKEPPSAQNSETGLAAVCDAKSKDIQSTVICNKRFFCWFSPRSSSKTRAHFDDSVKPEEKSKQKRLVGAPSISTLKGKATNLAAKYADILEAKGIEVLNAGESNVTPARPGVCEEISSKESKPGNDFESACPDIPSPEPKKSKLSHPTSENNVPPQSESCNEIPNITIKKPRPENKNANILNAGKSNVIPARPGVCEEISSKESKPENDFESACPDIPSLEPKKSKLRHPLSENNVPPQGDSCDEIPYITIKKPGAENKNANVLNAGESNVTPARPGVCEEISPKESKPGNDFESACPNIPSPEPKKSKLSHPLSENNVPPQGDSRDEIPYITIKKPGPENKNFRTLTSLFIVDLLRLTPTSRRNYYMFYDHVVHIVDVFGVITGVRQIGTSKILYQVDDGSGTIDCVHFTSKQEARLKSLEELLDGSEGDQTCSNISTVSNESINGNNLEYEEALKGFRTFMKDGFNQRMEDYEYKVGDTAYAKGVLYEFHEARNLYIYDICKVKDLSEETDRLLQMANFYRQVYPKSIPGFKESH